MLSCNIFLDVPSNLAEGRTKDAQRCSQDAQLTSQGPKIQSNELMTPARDPKQSFFVNPFEESWKRNQSRGIMEGDSLKER